MVTAARGLPSSMILCIIAFIFMSMADLSSAVILCRPPGCTCQLVLPGFSPEHYHEHYFRLMCPAVTVFWNKSPNVLEIYCNTNDVSYLNHLKEFQIGNLNTLVIDLCPLPSVSVSQFMQIMGVSNVTNVQITYKAVQGHFTTTVAHNLFHSLSNAISLKLHINIITQLPDDVFTNVANLTHIDSKNNNVILSKAIFCSMQKLEMLELSSNNVTYLEPGIFHNLTCLRFLKLSGNLRNISRAIFSDIHNLESLEINSNQMASLQPDLFEDLIKLQKIELQENEILSVPENLFLHNHELKTISLQDNRRSLQTLPPRLLAKLSLLKEVKLNNCNISTLPEDLLWGSTSVDTISLRNNTLTTLPELLFKDCKNLTILDISFNRIMDLSNKLFSKMSQLKTLLLNDNQLTVITDYLISPLDTLKILDLKNNRLTHITLGAFSQWCSLRVLNMSNNMLTFEGASVSPLSRCMWLEDIQLANNSLARLFPDWRNMNKLQTLNLSHNQISQLHVEYFDVSVTIPSNIYIDVSYNNISEIDIFSDKMFSPVIRQVNSNVVVIHIFVKGNAINSDCNDYTLFLYSLLKVTFYAIHILTTETKFDNLTHDKLEAHTGQWIDNVPLKPYTCLLGKDFNPVCSEECSCVLRYSDRALIIDCHQKNLTAMPEALPVIHITNHTELILSANSIKLVKSPLGPGYYKVTKYNLSHNMISEINLTAFSSKLQILELDGNSIDQFNTSSINFLLGAFNLTQLTLQNNPWKCDCSTKVLVTSIRRASHLKKIRSLDNTTCINGKTILKMSDSELCPVELQYVSDVSYIVAALGFGLLFGVLAFYYKFQNEIKVWLDTHHCCLHFIHEEELDKDKVNDAIVRYSHIVEDFVADEV